MNYKNAINLYKSIDYLVWTPTRGMVVAPMWDQVIKKSIIIGAWGLVVNSVEDLVEISMEDHIENKLKTYKFNE